MAFRAHLEARWGSSLLAEFCSKPWLLAEPHVDLNIGSLQGPRVQDEVMKELGNTPRRRAERILRGRHTSDMDRSSVLEEALGFVQLGLGTLDGLVAQDWEVMHGTKKTEAFPALTGSTMHDDDDGSEEHQGGGAGKGRDDRCHGSGCLAH